jgi:hypothetical protein
MTTEVRRTALGLSAALLLVGGCSADGPGPSTTGSPEPSASIRTLTPIPLPPDPPPSGRIIADMRQSSRDAAAGRMEVWVDNDTAEAMTPTRIVYRDPRFRRPVLGTRLRLVPSQSERGFPLYLPPRPACDATGATGSIELTARGTTKTIRVDDPTDVVGRYTSARCLELAVAKVADLSWDDQVPSDGEKGSPGTLTLVVRPTGRAGSTLTIDTVSGTPVLAPVGTDVWRPEARITGDGPPRRIHLPIKPNRCDDHAFLESGGATAFKIGLHLDGKAGQITLRMSTLGARNAIDFARRSCGALSTVSGG